MGLKIRIVIMKPDHRNDIFILKKKRLEGKKFTHENAAYFINDDHFQITTDSPWWRLWLFKRYFTTYYYVEGQSHPLPVPGFKGFRMETDGTWSADGETQEASPSSEVVAAAFNPWFYRIIAAPVRDVWQQIQFYVSVATLLGVIYIGWTLHQGDSQPAAEAATTAANP